MDKSLVYKIALAGIPRIGGVLAKKLISYTGSVEQVFKTRKSSLLKIPGVGKQLAENILASSSLERAEKEIDFIQKHKIKTFFYLDEDYPSRLKQCADCPVLLYSLGNASLNEGKFISIVGTRHATEYGVSVCAEIVKNLAEAGHEITIVSGLAYGIDIAAHKAAIQHQLPTVAVLGHGLQTIYPAVHKKYVRSIIEKGLLLTDFTSQCIIDKTNFIRRNRIIAGLSDATLVVESGEKGGALITADIANSYNRDVFAVPGRSTDNYSKGCNKLIKTNKAALVETATDIEYLMGWDKKDRQPAVQKQLFYDLSADEQKIIELLKTKDYTIDELCMSLRQPTSVISPRLLQMEFAGMINSLPGKVYRLVGGVVCEIE